MKFRDLSPYLKAPLTTSDEADKAEETTSEATNVDKDGTTSAKKKGAVKTSGPTSSPAQDSVTADDDDDAAGVVDVQKDLEDHREEEHSWHSRAMEGDDAKAKDSDFVIQDADGMDLEVPFLRDLLSDRPVEGGELKAARVEPANEAPGAKGGKASKKVVNVDTLSF